MSPDAICYRTGDNNIIPLYTNTSQPSESSGKTGTFNEIANTFGTVVITALQYVKFSTSSTNHYWLYVIFILPIITSLLRTILLLTVYNYDTPKFYILKNQK